MGLCLPSDWGSLKALDSPLRPGLPEGRAASPLSLELLEGIGLSPQMGPLHPSHPSGSRLPVGIPPRTLFVTLR